MEYIEWVMREHYKKTNKIRRLKTALETCETSIKGIKAILIDCEELIPSAGVAKFSGVGGAGNIGNGAEGEYIALTNNIDVMERQLFKLNKRRINLTIRVANLEAQTEGITFFIGMLEQEDREICDQSFTYRHVSNQCIADKLNTVESNIRRRKKVILKRLQQYLNTEKEGLKEGLK